MSTTTVAEIAAHYLSTGRVRKGDVPFLLSEIERRIPWPPDEATVEKVARELHRRYGGPLRWDSQFADEIDKSKALWAARAVLDALGGDR